MKIDNHDQIMKSLYPQETAKSRPAGEADFGRILKETVEKTPKPEAGPHRTAFSNALANVRLTPPALPDPKDTIDRIENMIDLLDEYRHKLADPQMNLKQIDAVIHEIARENDGLALLADSLTANDELKTILDHTRVTASLAVTKFYRGDYLPV